MVDCCKKNLYEVEEGEDRLTLIIVDFEMPMLSGLETVKEIKALYNMVNERIRKNFSSEKDPETGSAR